MKISATIITYNEERNLPRALESLRCADEIVVIDSGSTDRTVEIAKNLGARVVETVWLGYAQADVAGHVHDYGTKFLVGAGLLNVLGMVDAYEIATGQKD